MTPLQIVFLSLFAAISVFQLIMCFLEKEFLRKVTKPFCLLTLGIFAVICLPKYCLIYIGAFLGCIGDLFLIPKNKLHMFLIGTAFFIAGHICYLIQIVSLLSYQIPFYVFIIIAAVLLILTFALYPFTKGIAGKATMAGNFYMPFLLVMITMGVLLTVDKAPNMVSLLVPIGYVCFFASDATLVYTTYIKDVKRRDFYIMGTYLIAEFCIVFGLICTIGL